MSAQGGVYPQGVSAGGVSAGQRGVCPGGGVPPVDRMTDACENITLLQLCCGR